MSHYNDKYFAWQKKGGKFGGEENTRWFKEFIKEEHNIIEFGCGGGYLIKNIQCNNKIGIEINPYARNEAESIGIKTVDSADKIENDWADVIFSNHALEHTLEPINELKLLARKLKKDGLMIFMLPQEYGKKFTRNDINQHLYTWTPQCAYNMFNAAGLEVIKIDTFKYLWPPKAEFLRKLCGRKIFDLLCYLYCVLFADWHQIRVIAKKKI